MTNTSFDLSFVGRSGNLTIRQQRRRDGKRKGQGVGEAFSNSLLRRQVIRKFLLTIKDFGRTW